MSAPASQHLFPGETTEYRSARDQLLAEERRLKAAMARVAGLRRQLPIGGEAPNYALTEVDAAGAARQRSLADLFMPGRSTLLAVSLVYAEGMREPDPASVVLVDGLQSQAIHLLQRCNVAVISPASPAALAAYGRSRGWSRLRLVSSQGTRFGADYRAEAPDGRPLPACNVFVNQGGGVRHFWAAELLYEEDGNLSRHLDLLQPLWGYLDLLPDGRGEFSPKLDYTQELRDTLVSPIG